MSTLTEITEAEIRTATSPVQVTQEHVTPATPMGATVVASGATFRAWAPRAKDVYLMINADAKNWTPYSACRLMRDSRPGYWSGFVAGAKNGDRYRFYVVGEGSQGFKRDPYARELQAPDFPDCDCIIRDPSLYQWHDQNFHMPAFGDLIVYQLHVGTFFSVDHAGKDNRLTKVAKFLDVVKKIEYLAGLGINAIQLMPIDEYPTARSEGYNGVDIFSPELDYCVPQSEIEPYLQMVNVLLAQKGQAPLRPADLASGINQLKVLVDIAHLFEIAVFFDVVYNHAGGDFGDQSLYFFDRATKDSNHNSLYFTDAGWAGGLVYDYQKQEVRQFLIDNARFFLEEYHIDGIRYDEVTVIDRHGGWFFCQDLTGTVKFIKPGAIEIAEYWGDQRWRAVASRPEGMGFHAAWHDGMRQSIRGAISQAATGRESYVNMGSIRDALYRPYNFPAAWQAIQYLESHDTIDISHLDRQPRIAALSDGNNPRSWYGRSRSRLATGLLMTAPGIPMIFTGQEFLESRFWSDNPTPETLTSWDALNGNREMMDHLRFTGDLISLRRKQPALRAEAINVFHVHDGNRIICFHRWLENRGRDVVVVASLSESTLWGYQIGFPGSGRWLEVFNSDYYDNFPNPQVAGNAGSVIANGPGMHGFAASAAIVIPANAIIVFARDAGD